MRLDDAVVLRQPTETIFIAAARGFTSGPLRLASADQVKMLLRAHAGNALSMARLRRFWERYGGGGRRTGSPDASQLIDLVTESIGSGRFSALVLATHPHISSSDPTNKRAAVTNRVFELLLDPAQTPPLGSSASPPVKRDVATMSLTDRVIDVLYRTVPLVPGGIKAELSHLLRDPVRLAMLAGTIIVWIGLQSIAVGEVLDGIAFAAFFASVVIEGGSFAMTCEAMYDGVKFFTLFIGKLHGAKDEAGLDAAAKDLAGALGALSVQGLMAVAALGAGRIKTSAIKAGRGGRGGTGSKLTETEAAELRERLKRKG
jgi:hypothetical protein